MKSTAIVAPDKEILEMRQSTPIDLAERKRELMLMNREYKLKDMLAFLMGGGGEITLRIDGYDKDYPYFVADQDGRARQIVIERIESLLVEAAEVKRRHGRG